MMRISVSICRCSAAAARIGAYLGDHSIPYAGVPGRATVGAEVAITPVVNVAEPHLAVTVRMSHATALGLPTGFAASIAAGWQRPREVELKHVRVFIDGILVRNPLKPAGPWRAGTLRAGAPRSR